MTNQELQAQELPDDQGVKHESEGDSSPYAFFKSAALILLLCIAMMAVLFVVFAMNFSGYQRSRLMSDYDELSSKSRLHQLIVPEMVQCMSGRGARTLFVCEGSVGYAASLKGATQEAIQSVFKDVESVKRVTMTEFFGEVGAFFVKD